MWTTSNQKQGYMIVMHCTKKSLWIALIWISVIFVVYSTWCYHLLVLIKKDSFNILECYFLKIKINNKKLACLSISIFFVQQSVPQNPLCSKPSIPFPQPPFMPPSCNIVWLHDNEFQVILALKENDVVCVYLYLVINVLFDGLYIFCGFLETPNIVDILKTNLGFIFT